MGKSSLLLLWQADSRMPTLGSHANPHMGTLASPHVVGPCGLPALKGQAAEKVLMGNRLLVFSVQLCFVLHAERHYFSIENPLGSWTWPVAAVARPHAMPGVATVQVYYDQFGTKYSKPNLFLHNPPLLHKLSVPPRATPDKAIVLRGECWYKGEWRFKTR